MKEKTEERQVIEGLLAMISFMSNAFNLEAANVLHQTGWCSELISDNNCPVCKMEGEKDADDGNEEE
tara:strand:+ start:749 stop:949 length:201 start_codon:yes stop_codon:yes gene_type:complete